MITRVLCPASTSRSPTLQDPPAHGHDSTAQRSRIIRELIIFGAALIIGLIAVPLATWLVGNRILGPYAHGTNPNAGPLALVGDFFAGLGQGAVTFWIVALGPVALVLFVRLAWALIKSNPQPRGTPPSAERKQPTRKEPFVAKDRL